MRVLLLLLLLAVPAFGQSTTCCYTRTDNPDGSTLYKPAATPTPVPSPTPALNVNLLVCDGDSLTAGNGSTGGHTYPQDVADNLSASITSPNGFPWLIVNKGVSGQRLDTMVANAPTVIDSLFSSSYLSNVVAIFGGTNDIDLDGQTAAHVYAAEQAYGTARHARGALVIVVDMLPRAAGDEARRTELNGDLRGDFNVATGFAGVFKPKAGVTYADVLVDIASDPNIGQYQENLSQTYYDPDHTHLNNAGYVILASYVRNALRALGVAP